MQEENMTETAKKEKPEAKAKKKLKLGKDIVAMLSVSATVLVFILAFSCYGCSYQPITPPTPQEALDTFKGLYSSTWELDTAMGVTSLEEMGNIPIREFVIERKHVENESASMTIVFTGRPPMLTELAYRQGYGFTIVSGGQEFAVKLLKFPS